MLKILAMCDYVRVAEDEHVPEDAIELPSDEDGTILLSTIQAQFPGSTGLSQTGKFANCAPEIKISRKFCAPSFGNSAPGLQVCAGSF